MLVIAVLATGCAPAPRYVRSPEWRNGHFHNPSGTSYPGFKQTLRWRLEPGQHEKPFTAPFVRNDGEALRENRDSSSVTWIGHATTLLQAGGITILTDPVFSENIGLFHRLAPPGVALADLPPIDFVVISHNHRDHLDAASVRALGRDMQYVVPLGLKSWFHARGIDRVTELDWWQSTVVTTRSGLRAKVTMVPAQHWSQREAYDRNRTLWGGYIIDAGPTRFYFAGDTGYPAAFAEIGRRFPHIDFALLPIGAYAPRWFMHGQHMSPEDAARAFVELGAHTLVPIHWGTFHLTEEPMSEPPARLYRALGRLANQILFLPIGGSYFAKDSSSAAASR